MTERPILCSGSEVRAILSGRKTVTRRVYRPKMGYPKDDGEVTPTSSDHWIEWGPCPYGRAGDRLWVRETWQVVTGRQVGDLGAAVRYRDMEVKACQMPEDRALPLCLTWDRWRPSIHMPRWASRLTLEVTGIRVERLQTITEDGARAEGVWSEDVDLMEPSACRSAFRDLWDDTNGARPGASWEANPWVWVVAFRRVRVAP